MYNRRGESMEAIMGTPHVLNITYPAPQETTQGSPVVLPTSEQGTPTFSYTIQESDLPTFDGVPIAKTWVAMLYAAGQNTTGSNATICYRIKKNGVSIASATNLVATASLKWTLSMFNSNLVGVNVGDVIDVYLWQVTENALNWDWQGFVIHVSRVQVEAKKSRVLYNVTYTIDNVNPYPTFATGSRTGAGTVNIYVAASNTVSGGFSTVTLFVCQQHTTYNMFRIGTGDNDVGVSIFNHAANKPYYNTSGKVTKIEWTPTALGV